MWNVVWILDCRSSHFLLNVVEDLFCLTFQTHFRFVDLIAVMDILLIVPNQANLIQVPLCGICMLATMELVRVIKVELLALAVDVKIGIPWAFMFLLPQLNV